MNEKALLVSVVVPVFNGQDTIAACLDSLLALDYAEEQLEIVVVNNASTDKTAEVLGAYTDRITLLMESTRGPSAARNRGVRAASGEIIPFTDADCVVDRHWLRHLMQPLQDNKVGIVGGRILSVRPCNAIERFGESIHDHQKAIEVFKPPYAITMNWLSPRQVLIDAGLFDESYLRCEDVDLSQRILLRYYTMVYQPEATIYHRNERSFGGLFLEGFKHGVWAVKHNKHHHADNMRHGHRRFNFQSYRDIGANLLATIHPERRLTAFFQATFDIGKNCGKAVGSFRFGYIDL